MTQEMLEKMIRYHFQDRKYDACMRMLVQNKAQLEKGLEYWRLRPKTYQRRKMMNELKAKIDVNSELISCCAGIICTAIGN